MPKQIFKVSNFQGGLDEVSSPIDLLGDAFPKLQDVMVDNMGQLVPMGDFDVDPSDKPTNSGFIVEAMPGYGLFAWTAGRKRDGTVGDYRWYIIQKYDSGIGAGEYGSNFIVWDNDTATWSHAIDIENTTVASSVIPDFFVFDGILRICDGNMGANATTPTVNRAWY